MKHDTRIREYGSNMVLDICQISNLIFVNG